jgi:hypothetical protein
VPLSNGTIVPLRRWSDAVRIPIKMMGTRKKQKKKPFLFF